MFMFVLCSVQGSFFWIHSKEILSTQIAAPPSRVMSGTLPYDADPSKRIKVAALRAGLSNPEGRESSKIPKAMVHRRDPGRNLSKNTGSLRRQSQDDFELVPGPNMNNNRAQALIAEELEIAERGGAYPVEPKVQFSSAIMPIPEEEEWELGEEYFDVPREEEFHYRKYSDPGRRPLGLQTQTNIDKKYGGSGTELSLTGLHHGRKKPKIKSSVSLGNLSIISTSTVAADKKWNVFRSVSRSDDDNDPKWVVIGAQIFKVIVYILLHSIVLGCGFVSKMVILLMVSHLRQRTYIPCKEFGKGLYISQQQEILPENSVSWFYWSLWVAFCVPELFTLMRCLRNILFKFVPSPGIFLFAGAFLVETARTVGICLLVFVLLPQMDTVRAAMLLCGVANFPALLLFLTHFSRNLPTKSCFLSLLDAIALVCQIIALWFWPALDRNLKTPAVLPVSLILTSVGWWENFVSKSAELPVISWLGEMKEQLQRCRYKTHVILSVWKCALSLFCMIMAAGAQGFLREVFDLSNPFLNQTAPEADGVSEKDQAAYSRTVLILLLWLIISSMVCYQCAKYACKVKMERFSYAIPVVSVIPATIIVLVSFCEAKREQPCHFASWLLPDKIFWRCDYGDFFGGLLSDQAAWIWVLWFASYLWTVAHIFVQKPSRLSKTDTLFVQPMYDGWLVDQSLALNRRRYNIGRIKTKDLEDEEKDFSEGSLSSDLSLYYSMTSLSLANRNADSITKIYICATMWHETVTEMTQMLKSILRMDDDQCARKNAQKYLRVVDPDFYEMEAHIFFDDAWVTDPVTGFRMPNSYFRQFVSVMNDAASAVHKVPVELKCPCKMDLIYGGRLVWTLPGDNRLFVHLKDNSKIRHKKRWSQVMYMYYLLGHRIMELIQDTGRKQQLADNTYLLTIDGDSNFTPSAVQKLVDLMKKHNKLGAACGRIHPIGSGLIVWYQKFEYAIAHWFQKATEHVFGCVLCAPGCFSLFRGSALMDDNVMNKYTKLPNEPRHHVQYDQGEDRWLSTLMLKQGYRIEYAAAADAQTYAPEGFDEFFNQRRRWTPSSIANTLDLLADYKKVIRNNDSISKLYVFYQTLVILFSLLGPAIIFTMLIFAQVAAFHLRSDKVLYANLAPVLIFIILCFIASSKAQLLLARFLGIVYAFIMMAVLVGTGIQIAAEGLSSPTSIFVVAMAGIFSASAFFHPREFANIFYGAVFFLMIPTTYVVMSLYSLINLNVITWGTREAALRAAGKDVHHGTLLNQWLSRIPFLSKKGDELVERAESGKITCDCQRLCTCLLCPDEDRIDRHDRRLIWIGEKLDRLGEQVGYKTPLSRGGVQQRSEGYPSPFPPGGLASSTPNGTDDSPVAEVQVTEGTTGVVVEQPKQNGLKAESKGKVGFSDGDCKLSDEKTSVGAKGEDGRSLYFDIGDSTLADSDGAEKRREQREIADAKLDWMNLDYLKDGPNDILDELETQFWSAFVDEYLQPIQKTSEEEAEVVVGLRKLRDQIAFAILVANGLLVLIIYLLQNNKEILSIELTPYENYTWQKYDPASGKLETVMEPLMVEPIGLTIIIFLSLILGVQTIGMLMHRFYTASHVLASTVLSCFKRRKGRKVNGEKELEDNAIEIARNLQKLDEEYEGLGVDLMSPRSRKRKRKQEIQREKRRNRVVYNLEEAKKQRPRIRGLQAAFQKRFLGFNPQRSLDPPRPRQRRAARFGVNDGVTATESTKLRQAATAEAFRRRRDSLLREEPITRAPSRLHSHLSQPGRSLALVGKSELKRKLFGDRPGRPETFLDEINLELKRHNNTRY